MTVGIKTVNQQFIDDLIDLSIKAGEAILSVYRQKDAMNVEMKSDHSPVTQADLAAHNIIVEGLADLSQFPVLSEEGDIPSFVERSQWSQYWMIDPLDGTKEFIHGSGEFTVNIALIDNGEPVLGVVMVPAEAVCYWGVKGMGAFKQQGDVRTPLRVRTIDVQQPLRVVASRRHGADKIALLEDKLKAAFSEVDYCSMGSSLKLCLVAEGKADIYPRFAPTSEWDTAAAQAVVEAAGGSVMTTGFEVLRYNGKESLLNPDFYVIGDTDYPWQALLA